MAAALLLLASCTPAPHRVSLYTPFPKDQVWADVERKVQELGYTTTKSDQSTGVMVAQRASTAGDSEKEELSIKLAPDGSGNLKLEVSAARVLLASDGTVTKRSVAAGQTTAHANELLGVFLRKMK